MSTLLQLWREVCGRSPALVNQEGKHLIVGEADLILLGSEIERAMLAAAPNSNNDAAMHALSDAQHATPAAQSAGQEAVRNDVIWKVAEEIRQSGHAQAHEWADQLETSRAAFFEDVYDHCCELIRPLVDAQKMPGSVSETLAALIEHYNAAPVNGGEREQHPDDAAVDRFAAAMKAKLAKKRAQGRGGWDDERVCSPDDLANMLVKHVRKGDPVDVGNFAMMLFNRPDAGAALCRAADAPQEDGERPSDCSGEPECCPQNEGYGCHCGTRNSDVQRAADAPQVGGDEREADIDAHVIERFATILAEISLTLKGVEQPLQRHSYHDLPKLVAELKLEVDLHRANEARAALSADGDTQLFFDRQQAGFERCYEALGITDDRERSWSALILAITDALSADGGENIRKGKNGRWPRHIERAKRDAERWRYLREQHEGTESFEDAEGFVITAPTARAFTVFKPGRGDYHLEPVSCMPGELDATVDAAIAAKAKGE